MSTLTRGRLPARVYWTRRLVLLVVLVALVITVVQLAQLAGGSPSEPDRAAPMAADPTADPTDAAPRDVQAPAEESDAPRKHRDKPGKRDRERDKGPVLASPEGPCEDTDIAVTPTVKRAVGGGQVTFVLELRTITSAACTWQVSPQSVTAKITSGKDDIWSSLQCPRSIPRKNVVVRDNVSTEVEITWSGRRSDDGCTRNTEWAMPGWYFIKVAALAGEPSDLHFELHAPRPDVVTETVRPERDEKRDKERDGGKDRDRD